MDFSTENVESMEETRHKMSSSKFTTTYSFVADENIRKFDSTNHLPHFQSTNTTFLFRPQMTTTATSTRMTIPTMVTMQISAALFFAVILHLDILSSSLMKISLLPSY
uniref:Transmembrane protein n=1 Tax=Eucampia antarctica TaxID=49252 RepID=A0A7S2RHW2_9STRA|mmetsp:Transcript_22430/g.21568  ORF Transcript_22430/g.21568 Transcript_22430/m.21568 type:complete len:108 (+) Transcript_22430:552-875(+)